jgi:hypothetical protein
MGFQTLRHSSFHSAKFPLVGHYVLHRAIPGPENADSREILYQRERGPIIEPLECELNRLR